MNRKIQLLMVCVCTAVIARAQSDVTLSSLRRLYQSSYINPAFMPAYKTSIGIPVLSNIYLNNSRTGFTLQDVIDSKDEEGVLDMNKFQSKIQGGSIGVHTDFQTDLFHVNFPIGKFQIGLNSSLKVQEEQQFSKDFIGFLAGGNGSGPFKGQTVEFSALNINSFAYLASGISVSRKFKKLSVGARIKYLQGINSINTSDLRLSITTPQHSFDPIIIKSSGQVNTAGMPLLMDSVTGKEKSSNDNIANIYNFTNTGLGFDFGVVYQVLPKLQVHASVIDLGKINWKTNTYNYVLQNTDAQFGGFTYEQMNDPEGRGKSTDSLLSLLKDATITTKSFTTKLATRYFAGADYDLTKKDRLGFLFQGQQTSVKFNPAYTFSYTRRVGTRWDITTNYTMYKGSNASWGMGTALKLSIFQLYLIQDDILIYIRPNVSNMFYFRFGCNIVWGEVKQ